MNVGKFVKNMTTSNEEVRTSFEQKRKAFVEYEKQIMKSIYAKWETYFPVEIRHIIWEMTCPTHKTVSYNDIVIGSNNDRNSDEIYFQFKGGTHSIFEIRYKGNINYSEHITIPYPEVSIQTVSNLKEKIDAFADWAMFEKQLDDNIEVLYKKLKDWYDKKLQNEKAILDTIKIPEEKKTEPKRRRIVITIEEI